MPDTYQARRPGRAGRFRVRGLELQAWVWGDPAQATAQRPLRVLAHGWMDVGASFQFVVDALADAEVPVVAPDWRGFGGSSASGSDAYWFPDYLGDLDGLLDQLSPQHPVDLLGHSLGGNIVMAYAGTRPQRVRRLVNAEGFGLPGHPPDEAPRRMARWLDELKTTPRFRPYPDRAAVAARLRATHPGLDEAQADWLAPHWAREAAPGRWEVQGDPAHRRVNPVPYRPDEALAFWRAIEAPVLWVEGERTDITAWWDGRYTRDEFERRLAVVPKLQRARVAQAGHMLHFDQPRALAALLDAFWG